MTQTTIRTRVSILARISAWVRRHQDELSARIHAAQTNKPGSTAGQSPRLPGGSASKPAATGILASRTDAGNLKRSWQANREATAACRVARIPEMPSGSCGRPITA
jgi:hypothetical protein